MFLNWPKNLPSITLIRSLALFLISLPIAAQEQISFRQLSIKDGLSQNCGISITQDSTGYLWIATQDGLNRYDGSEFVKYPFIFSDITRPEFSHLGKVYVDRSGAVWSIPVSRVLHRYFPARGSFESYPEISDASVLHCDTDNRYWVGTYQGGLQFFSWEGDAVVLKGTVDIPATIYDLAESGEFLLAATGSGVWVIRRRTGEITAHLREIPTGERISGAFSTIATGPGGRHWFGTYGQGLYFKESGGGSLRPASGIIPADDLPEDLNILSLFRDSRDRLWIGTYGEGLYLLDLNTLEVRHFMADKGNERAIHYNDILSIYEDYTGTLWFGTDGAGLSYYDEYLEKFNSITNEQVPDDINVDVVRAIERDEQDNVWIGTSGKGLMQYQASLGRWQKFTRRDGLPSDRIMSLFHDGGELWIGTQGGGLSIHTEDGRMVNLSGKPGFGVGEITIWDIHRDHQGRTWLATRENGLLEFDRDRGVLRIFNPEASPQTPVFRNIRVITEGEEGTLWLGGESEGLIRLNPDSGSFEQFRTGSEPDDLPNDKIKSLYYDPSGRLWIGTNGSGISVLDPADGTFRTYSEKDGLANNVVYAVLPDGSGSLWLSSNRGITRFDPPEKWTQPPGVYNYTNYEGLATEFNTGASYIHSDGTLYFGGLEGFYWFNPAEIQLNPYLPKTAITGMQVANEPFPIGTDTELTHRENTLTFTFSSQQFSLPGENEYRYRLLDYETDWIYAGHTNFARYSFLPPGSYEFQVQSSNYDGIWNPDPATLSFTIAPPWHATLWARLLYLLAGLLTLWFIYQHFRSRWRMRLDQAEKERLQRLNDFKSRLYTDISHEIRTPLSLISAPVEAKLKEGKLSDSEYARYSLINRNTNRIIALVDQMLHLAKLEKGKLSLKLEEGDPGLFLRVLVRSFEYPAEQAGVRLHGKIADTGPGWFDPDILEKIATNLLSNAVKYSPSGGDCIFEASMEAGYLELEVSNTVEDPGKIDPDQLFSRFYQVDGKSEGSGVGLALVKELVDLYEGSITATLSGNRIHFRIKLPAKAEGITKAEQVVFPQVHQSSPSESGATEKAQSRATEKTDQPILLVVEDHEEIREYLSSVWEGKYTILTEPDGESGLNCARESVPDLVLTDIRMPGISGIELCNRLKTDERTSHIPVILLTSGAGVEQELRGLESGADDFVTKPFKLAVLEKRIDNLIRSRRSLRDLYARQFVLNVKEIAVTPADEAFLKRIQDILDSHLSDAEFNAAAFARKAGMSRMQLHRKLQAFTGLSTTAFLRSQRLKQAERLLRENDLSVNEVAYSVGFNTPSYFIKCFREAYGTTPSEYT